MNQPSLTQKKVKRILVACIGNIFLGDDGFGVEVAQRLLRCDSRPFSSHVQIIDFGIRGFDLAYALLEDFDALVLVDAIQRGGPPGTLYVLEPELSDITPEEGARAAQVGLDAHSMDPFKVLAYARTLGARPVRTLLVGCEPSLISGNEAFMDLQMGLSKPVQAALPRAVELIDSLIRDLLEP